MSQKRKKRELVFTITATVYTDFMEELITSFMFLYHEALVRFGEQKGKATKFTYKKEIKTK